MKRTYPERPLVAVSAVIFQGDRVVLARRDREPGKGMWSLPGGAVEVGERMVEAAKREIREETYLDVEIRGLVGVFDRIVRDVEGRVKYHYVLVDYWGWVVGGSLCAGSDTKEVIWLSLSEVDNFGLDRELKSTIKKAALQRGESTEGQSAPED